jgi:transcriptional regulator GlxA family with amidase domain
LVVIPAGLPHSLQVGTGALAESRGSDGADEGGLMRLQAGPPDAEALLVACGHVKATWAGSVNLFGDLDTPLVVNFADTPHMRAVFETLLTEQRAAATGRMQMLSALMLQCLIGLLRRVCSAPDCDLPWLAGLEDPRLGRAMRRVLDAPQDPHTLDSLAREAAMSRSAFAARFQAALRKTPMDYVREVRLREAARLLRRGDLPIEVVAARTGFASRSHFSRAFRKTFGKPPSAWRKTI